MSDARSEMIQALKSGVVPILRERGFTGSFPHFRHLQPSRINLITFQFDRHGGGFVIELSQCDPEGFTTHWGKKIPPSKVTAWDLPPQRRVRIKRLKGPGTDSWFRYVPQPRQRRSLPSLNRSCHLCSILRRCSMISTEPSKWLERCDQQSLHENACLSPNLPPFLRCRETLNAFFRLTLGSRDSWEIGLTRTRQPFKLDGRLAIVMAETRDRLGDLNRNIEDIVRVTPLHLRRAQPVTNGGEYGRKVSLGIEVLKAPLRIMYH